MRPALELIDSVDELKEAIASPDAFLERLQVCISHRTCLISFRIHDVRPCFTCCPAYTCSSLLSRVSDFSGYLFRQSGRVGM